MIKIPYDDMKFHYITGHYDVHWSGTCIYDNKIAEFKTLDETDYDAMMDACPCCRTNGSDNYKECNCTVYPDLFCIITPLPLHKRISWMLRKIYYKRIYHKSFAY